MTNMRYGFPHPQNTKRIRHFGLQTKWFECCIFCLTDLTFRYLFLDFVLLHFWAFVGSQFISDTFSHHLSGLGSNARQWLNINPISNIKLYIYTILYCSKTLCIDNLHNISHKSWFLILCCTKKLILKTFVSKWAIFNTQFPFDHLSSFLSIIINRLNMKYSYSKYCN